MENNVPLYSRLKPNVVHLIFQKYKELNVTVQGKTKCGYKTQYPNYTIGHDRFTLHPFQECFRKDPIINLNGQSYAWNNSFNKYTLVHPTYHLATINLQKKFQELDNNELKYRLQHHAAFDDELEQKNTFSEFITRKHEGEGDSISFLVLNKKAESWFWHLSSLTFSLKSSLMSTNILIPLFTLACIAISYFRSKRVKYQMNLPNLR